MGMDCLEHIFSIEMKSKRHVKSISVSDDTRDLVLFEGNLGEFRDLSVSDGDVLELIGENGVLRLSVTREQLQRAIAESALSPKEK